MVKNFVFAVLVSINFCQAQSTNNLGELPVFPWELTVDVIFVCDQSSSMSDEGRIDQENQSLGVFFDEVKGDTTYRIAVIGFHTNAQVVRQIASVGIGEKSPVLIAEGSTDMAGAIREAHSIITKNRKANATKPVVVLITDGMPNDRGATLQAALDLQKEAHFFALGVAGADSTYLLQLTENNAAIAKDAQYLTSFIQDTKMSIDNYLLSHQILTKGSNRFTVKDTRGWAKK